jgi:hypothetical protein
VLADGKVVGRILQEETSGPPELRWGWSITVIVPATKGVTNGNRRDARRGDGQVSGGVGSERKQLIIHRSEFSEDH